MNLKALIAYFFVILMPFWSMLCFGANGSTCINALVAVTSLPIPTDAIPIIENHPIFRLRSRYGEGDGLSFTVSHYKEGDLTKSVNLGEQIQADFIVKTLKVIFPRAKFYGEGDNGYLFGGGLNVIIRIGDRGEFQIGKNRIDVDMPLIKAANGVISSVRRGELRNWLGISQNAKIVDFYFNFRNETTLIDTKYQFANLYDLTRKGLQGVDVVFYSEPYITQELLLSRIDKSIRDQFEIRYLSELKQYDLAGRKSDKPLLILNDLAGIMGHIHGSSDITIIRGPINMFESLNVGTPTIVIHNQEIQENYDINAFNQMVDVARQTGGGVTISQLDMLPKAIQSQSGKRVNVRPYLVQDSKGLTPLRALLDTLQRRIEEYGPR